ncbi:hypothetical protein RD792_003871 [Penstemon davidsonii]|uniref:Reverse transcriptase zinc-binding domain-containing protein n=1 Tax=Penstemon davidsonii TaxID=160366 RepID=A0ABR0DGH6_9LAMI|nr:hypothetical protein RD792_003871 [Penstemon davidsonii]
MTNSIRFDRGSAHYDMCSICSLAREDIIHSLRDCHKARQVWDLIISPADSLLFTSIPHPNWIRNTLNSKITSSCILNYILLCGLGDGHLLNFVLNTSNEKSATCAPFNSAACPDSLAIAIEGELKIVTIDDDIQKLHLASMHRLLDNLLDELAMLYREH